MWGEIRPQVCVKLGPHALVWAESRRELRGRHDRCAVRPLRPGLLRPSPVDLNITDPAAFGTELEALLSPRRQRRGPLPGGLARLPVPTTVLIPDLSVRAAILHLEQLPARVDEQAALIRWSAAREQLLPVTGTKVDYQVLSDPRGGGPVTVLAVAVRESVLEQFESVCEAAGLYPLEVETVTLRLFNLWARATGWYRTPDPTGLIWVSVADAGLTVLILHRGEPVYLRTKLLGAALKSEEGYRDEAFHIRDEVIASAASCVDRVSNLTLRRLVLASDASRLDLLETLSQELNVEGEELNWLAAQRSGWRAEQTPGALSSLQAVAGLLGR